MRQSFDIPLRRKWLLTYFALFALPVVVAGAVGFVWVTDNAKRQWTDAFAADAQSVIESIDEEFMKLNVFSRQLSELHWIQKSMMVHAYNLDPIDIKNYFAELVLYNSMSGFYEDIGLFFHNHQFVISSLGYADYATQGMLHVDSMDEAAWSALLREKTDIGNIVPATIVTYGRKREGLLFVDSLPKQYDTVRAAFVAFISNKTLTELTQPMESHGDVSVYMLGRDNTLLFEHHASDSPDAAARDVAPLLPDDASAAADIRMADEAGRSLMVMAVTAQTPDLRFVFVIPDEGMLREVRWLQWVAAGIVALTLAAGFWLSHRLAWSNFRPMNELMSKLHGHGQPSPPTMKRNEWGMIQTSIQRMMQQEAELRSKLQKQRPALQQYYMLRLFHPHADDVEETVKALELIGVKLPFEYFAVGAIRETAAADCGAIESIAVKAAKECDMLIYMAEEKACRYMLANFPHEQAFSNWVASMRHTFARMSATVGIGSVVHGARNIGYACRSAQLVTDYRTLDPSAGGIVLYSEMKQRHVSSYLLDKENMLINQLRVGDAEQALATAEQLLDGARDGRAFSMNTLKFLASTIVVSGLKSLRGIDSVSALRHDPGKVFELEEVEECRAYVREFIAGVCAIVKEKTHVGRKIDAILYYIDQHYDHGELSLDMLAEQFRLSGAHVSAMFKDEVGQNFLDYLNRKRIERAKSLLHYSERGINEIAFAVGYNNDVTFRRLFKKYNGVTPSEYRQINVWKDGAEGAGG